ncbi:pentapeptide repeat-containing protein [Nocardia abscessus]|uniref:pentapeptide repeat-containing protein n=1 Tax=Nocardia abscessus TaxID=120957 RepID=UPI0024539A09|nr:pentapeptide repeat-containing protein [Nocardia abscessus]
MIMAFVYAQGTTPTPTPAPRWSPADPYFPSQPQATIIAATGVIVAAIITFLIAYLARRQGERHFQHSGRKDRYTTAAEQLSHTSAAVRLAGVHTLEALTDEWLAIPLLTFPKRRRRDRAEAQACLNVLCAYLRLPFDPIARDPAQTKKVITYRAPDNAEIEHHFEYRHHDDAVRDTISRIIGAHVTGKTLGRSWSRLDFDLSDAYLPNLRCRDPAFDGFVSFARAQFPTSISFSGTRFANDTIFDDAVFHGAADISRCMFGGNTSSFTRARFTGPAEFVDCLFLSDVCSFAQTRFSGDTCRFEGSRFPWGADFSGAIIRGSAFFEFCTFRGMNTNFDGVEFHRGCSFEQAKFFSEVTSFAGMTLSAADSDDSYTSFQGVRCDSVILSFSDTHFGQPSDFDRAVFSSNSIEFHGAIFESEANFKKVVFIGSRTYFDLAEFRRGVDYSDAEFRSRLKTQFNGVTFAGATSFSRALFDSPTLFASVHFMAPSITYKGAQFRKEVAFVHPAAWCNVEVDWDVPVPYVPHGQQPSTVTPTEWPPTSVVTEDETTLEEVTIDEHAMAREFFHRDRRREFMRTLARLKRFMQRRMRRWW